MRFEKKYEAIVIGTSAGGLGTLQKILSKLPSDFALPILVVQHRLPAADQFLSIFLNDVCQLAVKEADNKEIIKPPMVYVAPSNYHLLVERTKTISLTVDPKVKYSRPSIDALFETAAEAYLSKLIGIILTGANNDGTAGLKKIKEHGGLTIAQNPQTAEVSIMPMSAIQANVVDKVLSLTEMAPFLNQISDEVKVYERRYHKLNMERQSSL